MALGNLDARARLGLRRRLRRGDVADAAAGRGRRLRHRHRRDPLDPRASSTSRSRHVGIDDWAELRHAGPALHAPRRGRPAHRRRDARRKDKLGWTPTVGFAELVAMMVDNDLASSEGAAGDRSALSSPGIGGQDGTYLAERLRGRGHGGARARASRPTVTRPTARSEVVLARRRPRATSRRPTAACARSRPTRGLQPRGDQLGRAVVGAARPHRAGQRPRRGGADGVGAPAQERRYAVRSCRRRARRSSARPRPRRRTRTPRSRRSTRTAPRRRTPTTSVRVYRAARPARRRACILYNHESPRRPTALRDPQDHRRRSPRSPRGEADELALGNLDARRDWGWAPDYVDAMVRAARADEPGDYVIATGTAHSVRDFVAAAFARCRHRRLGAARAGGRRRSSGRPTRPSSSATRAGRASELGWTPDGGVRRDRRRMVATDLA